ncbi:MAG: three-Cys-motif partner protein TcmP [Deltaproteobacteria bacterium]|nr:three-Cys-motif partner protein TcmP [Deltaproteobacteria bacterium]
MNTERANSIMAKTRTTSKGSTHRFGGDWTDAKLDVLAKYLNATRRRWRAKPTPEQPFRKAYIDAFAGTGTRTARARGVERRLRDLLFPDLAEAAPQKLLDGSAKLALQVEPRFDKYIFIERSPERCQQLEGLKDRVFQPMTTSTFARRSERSHPEALSRPLEVEVPWRGALPRPLRHAGRVADHRGHREDEGDRPLAALPPRYRRQPTAHALGRDSEGLADAASTSASGRRPGTTSSTRSRQSPRCSAITRSRSSRRRRT